MERWRWYPRDLGNAHVIVNMPDYTLRVMHNGEQVWTTRIVIGKPDMPTPLLSETMKYITINPTWNVPPSIVQNEYLPALPQDPTVLARMGLKVVYNRDGSVHIYQPPGEANALGRMRFNFPNRFLVYQHDTPDKHLFAHDVRAYSHGCMRVQDPAKYAEVLLQHRAAERATGPQTRSGSCTARPSRTSTARRRSGCTSPTRPRSSTTPASCRSAATSTISTPQDAAISSERGMVEPAQERKREQEVEHDPDQAGTSEGGQQPRTVGFFESLFGGGGNARRRPRPDSAASPLSDAFRRRSRSDGRRICSRRSSRLTVGFFAVGLTPATFCHSPLAAIEPSGGTGPRTVTAH